MRYQDRYWADDKFEIVEQIAQVADDLGIATTTLAIAWVMANPRITAPIIGASRSEQLAASIAGADVVLEPEVIGRLDELTRSYRTVDAVR